MMETNIVALYFNKQKQEGVKLLENNQIKIIFNIKDILDVEKKYKFEINNDLILLKCNKKEKIFLLLQKEDKDIKDNIIKSFYNNGYPYLLDKNSIWSLNSSINSLSNQIIPKIETLIFSNMTFKEELYTNLSNLEKTIETNKEINKNIIADKIKKENEKTQEIIVSITQKEKEELLSFFEENNKKYIILIKELFNEIKGSIEHHLKKEKESNKNNVLELKKIDFSNVFFIIHHGKTRFVLFGEVETKDDVAFISIKKRDLELETTNKNIFKYSNNKDLFFYLSDNFDVELLKDYLPNKTFKEVKSIYKNTFSKKLEIIITIAFIISIVSTFITNYNKDKIENNLISKQTQNKVLINKTEDNNSSLNKLLKSLEK